MSQSKDGRREFLMHGTGLLSVAALSGTTIPFLASWQPTDATRLSGAPARVDVSKLQTGEGIKMLWRGTPMWVVKRSADVTQVLVLKGAPAPTNLPVPEHYFADDDTLVIGAAGE